MHIIDAWLHEKKEASPPKPNLARMKAQPLLESKIEEIRARYEQIDYDLSGQLCEESRRFEGRSKINRTCWDCGTVNTLVVQWQGVRPFASGQCYRCGTAMWTGAKIRVGMYPNEIRDALFNKEDVGVRHLIDFMHENGMPDLKLKYIGTPIEKFYSGRETASRNAKRDEAILAEIMKPVYSVAVEQHIGFKVDGEPRDRTCHPDVIAGGEEFVFVLEMKMGSGDIKEEQLSKYHRCMKILLSKQKAPRSVATVAVVAERDSYTDAACATLAELLPLRDIEKMQPFLLKHATHISRWTGESYIDER